MLLAAAFLYAGSALSAQTVASLGVGASIVEYDGFLTSAAAALTPALQFDSPKFSIGGQGNWTVFESGNQIFQATAAAGWLTAPHQHWRVELAGTGGVSNYADERSVGHVLGRSRLHFFALDYGVWVGATAGASFDSSTVAPLELAFGVWTVRQSVTVVGLVTTAWLGDDRHLDVAGAARWGAKRWELEARIGTRPWTRSGGGVGEAISGIWAEVSAQVPLTRQISLTMSGGSYPSDPVRRVLGAKYLTAGFRIATSTERFPEFIDPARIIAAARARNTVSNAANARIEITLAGSLHAIRIHAEGAKLVELMGDFTDWEPVSLAHIGNGMWELQRELALGIHRLNVRIDGGAWIVPEGARQEQDDFGTVVGIIVIR